MRNTIRVVGIVLSIVLLFISVIIVGCGDETTTTTDMQTETSDTQAETSDTQAETSDTQAETTDGDVRLDFVAGSMGGSWWVAVEGMAEVIRRDTDYQVTVVPGGLNENPLLVGGGQAQVGFLHGFLASRALTGEKPYEGKAMGDSLRAIGLCYTGSKMQYWVSTDSGINSIEEIIKNKMPIGISVNKKDSMQDLITQEIFKAYGAELDDVEDWGGKVYYLSLSETSDAMKNRKIDMFVNVGPLPTGKIDELMSAIELKLLPLDPSIVEEIATNINSPIEVIEAGTYPFIKEDIRAIASPVLIGINGDLSDEIAYNITKAYIENRQTLIDGYKPMGTIKTVEGLTDTPIPLHPGAEKYYRDEGILK